MFPLPAILLAAVVWLGLLFGVALWGERRFAAPGGQWRFVYALSLAVYCTSWTFYGTVTQAARSGWPIPPTFLGTILLYVLGGTVMLRLVRLARQAHAGSLADLIASRLGKDARLAAVVTAVAVLGMLPYIALQLKAVAMSFQMLAGAGRDAAPWQDSALYVALFMALFAILFGARRAASTEHNRGLILAMAFESLFKLGVMLAIGAMVLFAWPSLPAIEFPAAGGDRSGFAPLVVLGVLAMFTLPHQFHVGVVECRSGGDVATARWLFPLYLVLIALPILPLAYAGEALLAPRGVPSDLYVLALPLAGGHEWLALAAFLGGLSAATGMVIVATLALGIMIGNHWVAPLLVRGSWASAGGDLRAAVLNLRRLAILALLLLAWQYNRVLAGNDVLADIGAVSFSALATLAPALAFAVWRPATPPSAVLGGIVAAVGLWSWLLLVPLGYETAAASPAWLDGGPWGSAWLAPDRFAGLAGWSRLGRAVLVSLFGGTLVTVLLTRRRPAMVAAAGAPLDRTLLRDLAARFIPAGEIEALFSGTAAAAASETLERQVERALAAVLGSASARLLLDTARRRRGDLERVVEWVGETSETLRFNQQLLEAALHNMSQGISVVDARFRLVAWNRRYAELFGFPESLLYVGTPIAHLQRYAIEQGYIPRRGSLDEMIARRQNHMRAGTRHLSERRFPDGTIVEIRGNPMPGGGFVATFTDVTAFRRAESELKAIALSLEERVAERTAELAAASAAAEQANRAKSRLLAAVSHDLVQPVHAARLFAQALASQLSTTAQREGLERVLGALASSEALLADLLDLSRLESGGLRADIQAFDLNELLAGLASEFTVLAAERGLRFKARGTTCWALSDPALLRRIVQNFLANAVRYTRRGRILLGCRRAAGGIRIEVHDTGPGVPPALHQAIFEEFRRGEGPERPAAGGGLGLGLAIARRTAGLLGHPIGLTSTPGKGSVFHVSLPRAVPGERGVEAATLEQPDSGGGAAVLVIDDDREVLEATVALLRSWGFKAGGAGDWPSAERLYRKLEPALLILDYHLAEPEMSGTDGVELWRHLVGNGRRPPVIVVTADRADRVREAVAADGLVLLHKPLKPLALRALMNRLL